MIKVQQSNPSIANINNLEANYQLLLKKGAMKQRIILTEVSPLARSVVPLLAQREIVLYLRENPIKNDLFLMVDLEAMDQITQKITFRCGESGEVIAERTVEIPVVTGETPMDSEVMVACNGWRNKIYTILEATMGLP